jgi:hypothetical protein
MNNHLFLLEPPGLQEALQAADQFFLGHLLGAIPSKGRGRPLVICGSQETDYFLADPGALSTTSDRIAVQLVTKKCSRQVDPRRLASARRMGLACVGAAMD